MTSEDKSQIMVFKINSKNKSKFIITTLFLMLNWHFKSAPVLR